MNTANNPATRLATTAPGPARRSPARHGWVGLMLGATLVTMALVAGLNFTFAVAVMPNLAGVDDHTFVTIMQRFNDNEQCLKPVDDEEGSYPPG